MSDNEDVKEFTRMIGLEIPPRPTLMTPEMLAFRIDCLREELGEFEIAAQDNDMENMVDALIDLVYFAHGTAILMGVNWPLHWDEVHSANMRKRRGITKRGRDFDASKPVNWIGPDHKRHLNASE